MITFNIPEIQGKARHRTAYNYKTGKVIAYTPAKTKRYEQTIALLAKASMSKQSLKVLPKTIPVALDIKIYDKKLIKKPDTDNITKVIKDALNNVVYQDDVQVTKEVAEKFVTEKEPCIRVRVSW